jgi:hypothetical protein
MNNHVKNATDFAFSDNVAEMSSEIENALMYKVASALEAKRVEVAQSLMFPVTEEEDLQELSKDTLKSYKDKAQWDVGTTPEMEKKRNKGLETAEKKIASKGKEEVAETALVGKQTKLDKNKNGKLDDQDFKLLRKESEELEEVLKVSDGVDAWIKDFVHSDNPKFEGKSKKDRIQMALGAFYAAKKGTNEGIEESSNIGWAKKKSMETNPVFRKKILDAQSKRKERAEIAKMSAKTKNEEVEKLEELSTDTMKSYKDKAQWDVGTTPEMEKKRNKGLETAEKKIAANEKAKKAYTKARQW